jgi:hypothetical protein
MLDCLGPQVIPPRSVGGEQLSAVDADSWLAVSAAEELKPVNPERRDHILARGVEQGGTGPRVRQAASLLGFAAKQVPAPCARAAGPGGARRSSAPTEADRPALRLLVVERSTVAQGQ